MQSKVLSNVAEAIGHTPLVRIDRFIKSHNVKGEIYAKLEYLNPGFSKKDRIAKQMIHEARRDGSLKEKQPVVELTSGNTGTGLAIVCAALGHPFTAVMSQGNSVERARMMKSLGAEVCLVPQAPGSKPGFVSAADLELVQAETMRLVRERGAFRADQFNLLANENAHYKGTGPEVWSVLRPTSFVDFAGTGGTFSGVARFLKEQNSKIFCGWVIPSSKSHPIQGGGYFCAPDGSALKFEALSRSRGHIDEIIQVDAQESIDAARRLASLEGIFGGFSAGANAAAALRYLRRKDSDTEKVVIMVCDSGLKYLSTDLYP